MQQGLPRQTKPHPWTGRFPGWGAWNADTPLPGRRAFVESVRSQARLRDILLAVRILRGDGLELRLDLQEGVDQVRIEVASPGLRG